MNREPITEHAHCELRPPTSGRQKIDGLAYCVDHDLYVDRRTYASRLKLDQAAATVPRTVLSVYVLADYAACRWTDELQAWYDADMPGNQPVHYVNAFDGPARGPQLP